MDTVELWARADEHFAARPDADMRAHAESVLRHARELLRRGAPARPEIVIPAAILHDIGIPTAIKLYGSSGSPGQEVEGAVMARDILVELGCEPQQVEAICGIIAVHHHRPRHPTDEFKVVYDADLLVNAAEAGKSCSQIAEHLYTPAGRVLAGEVLPSGQKMLGPDCQGCPGC